MTKYKVRKSKQAVLRWCSISDVKYKDLIQYALETILPIFEDAGFIWVEKNLDGFKTPIHIIDLERREAHYADRITIIFDKYKRYKFKFIVRTKELEVPNKWIKDYGDSYRIY